MELYRHRILSDGTCSEEIVYLISSLPAEQNKRRLFDSIRSHWGIENKLHGRRDGTYNEDKCRIRKSNRAHAMASMRNLTIGLYEHQNRLFPKLKAKSLPHFHEIYASATYKAVQWITKTINFQSA